MSEAFKKHVQADKPAQSVKHAVVYLSGLATASSNLVPQLSDSLCKVFPSLKKDPTAKGVSGLTLIAMTPEKLFSIPAASSQLEVAAYFALSPDSVPAIDENARVAHLVLAQVYRKPAGYHKAGGDLKPGTKLWHTIRRKEWLVSARSKTEEMLEKAIEPSILQLAVKANKRSMGRVIKVGGEYKILNVKDSLKGTLWYL